MRVRLLPVAAVLSSALVGALIAIPLESAQAQSGLIYAEVGSDSQGAELLVGALGGPAPHMVFQGRYPSSVAHPAVSPDGGRVAYVEDDGNGNRIAVVGTDGTNHLVVSGKEAVRYGPVWSPDGTKLYFSVKTSCGGCGRTLVVPADGSAPAAPVPNGNNSDPQSLRRDGQFICFGYLPAGTRHERLGIMRLDGTQRHGVGPKDLFTAAWRPHSNLVAVSRYLKDVISTGPVIIQIQLVNVATGRSRPLTATQDPSKSGTAYPLAWSPDGTYLYYQHFAVAGDQETRSQIYRIRLDGTGKTNVTPRGFTGGSPGFFGLQSR